MILSATLFLASAYFYQDPGWNGNSRLDLTRSIVEQHSLAIDSYKSRGVWTTADLAYYGGHYYSDKAIGSSLLAVPLYFLLFKLGLTSSSALVKHLLTTVVMGTGFTANGLAMYVLAQKFAQQPWQAVVSTLAISLGTMLWPYSAVYYGHVPAAAFLMVSFYLLLGTNPEWSSVSRWRFFGAGLAAGLSFLMEYTAAVIIVGLLFYGEYRMRKARLSTLVGCGIIGGVGALIPLIMLFAYNMHVYGTPLTTGYSYEAVPYFQEGMSRGLMGIGLPDLATLYHITFDPRIGLFWLSPVLLLSPLGFFAAMKTSQFRAEALLCLWAIVAMLALNSGYYLWWGGGAFGPRLLIPALPFFVVPLVLLPDSLKWLLGVLGIVSSLQMLIPLMGRIQPDLIYRAAEDAFYITKTRFSGFSLLYDYNLPLIRSQLADRAASWTLGTALGLPYWLSVPTLLGAESVLLLLLRRETVAIDRHRGEVLQFSAAEGSPPSEATASPPMTRDAK